MSDARARALRLYRGSVLKQEKFRALRRFVRPVTSERCLELGSEDGVMSLLLRSLGGAWRSADLDADAVASIRLVVDGPAELLTGPTLPYADDSFELVAIVDMLEHLDDDRELISEVARVLVPGGRLIVNVPHDRPRSRLRQLRLRLGLSDQKHGHVRAGYTVESLRQALGGRFDVESVQTYVGVCAELIDILINWYLDQKRGVKPAVDRREERETSGQQAPADGSQLARHMVFPFVKAFSLLDRVVPLRSGAMLILSARLALRRQEA